MGLEDEIRQDRFYSEHHKAVINIMFTSSWLYNQNTGFLKPFGLTPEQFNVLRILRGSYPTPLRLTDITARMIDKNSNATRLVEKLRQKGMVSREICENNRRQVDIAVTEKGLRVLAEIDRAESRWAGIVNRISEQDAQELNRILDLLRG